MEQIIGGLIGNMPAEELQAALNFAPPTEPMEPITKVLRTPEHQFKKLKDYPFTPNYIQTSFHGDIRIHYVDEGPRDAKETLLLMHGEPSWSYLYRHMIPRLVNYGYRVVAPDLVGFGKSDKPALQTDHSYERQVNWMTDLVVQLGLKQVTLFAQDWGGLIGLRIVARLPERFARVAIGNTGLPVGDGVASEVFKVWAGVVSQKIPAWAPLMQSATERELSEEELQAYEAPFPSEEYKAASRVYPRLVPQSAEHGSVEENKAAWRRIFAQWKKPFLTLFSDKDPITKGGEAPWQAVVPGSKGQKHAIIEGGGHFLQEDQPELICNHLKSFVEANPLSKLPAKM